MSKNRKFSLIDWVLEHSEAAVLIFMGFILLIYLIISIVWSFNSHTYTITITDKDRINKSNTSYYLVYGDDEDGNTVVLKNKDSLWRWKWNSSDIQGQLKEGQTYKITVTGYRVPIFSQYENIINISLIE